MFKELVTKRNELIAKQAKLKTIFDEGKKGKDIDLDLIVSLKGTNEEKLNEIRKLNEELDALGKEVESLVALEESAKRMSGQDTTKNQRFSQDTGKSENKGIGDLFVETDNYKNWRRGMPIICKIKNGIDALLKAVFQTTAGWAPESIRTGRVIEAALRPIQVIDTIPGGITTQQSIIYMEETTATSAAAERAESAAYAESSLEMTEQTSNVRSIGTSLPVTDEQLEDVEQVKSYINQRLGFFIRQRLDSQILVGNGTPPNLLGMNNVSGVLTQAKGTDPGPDAIYKAMNKIRVTGRAHPNIVYAHPYDWQDIRLLKTADGIYIWGNPSEAGPMRIWGILVVETDAQTENTNLVVDTSFTQLYMRKDVTVEIGYVNTDFKEGRVTVRAGLRAAFVVYRPAAICQVTGM